MRELIVHIGASKCASSTVQGFLSLNPVMAAGGRTYVYACLDNNGAVLHGEELAEAGRHSVFGYAASYVAFDWVEQLGQGLRQIADIFDGDESVIISNEGFWNLGIDPSSATIFDDLDVPVRVFMLTRPPVDWANAGWWQWGCWEYETVGDWCDSIGFVDYKAGLDQWKQLRRLKQAYVADISQGPIPCLLDFLDITSGDFVYPEDLNVASSAEVLRLLLGNREMFGRRTHEPEVEFRLNALLDYKGPKPPFALSEAMVRRLVAGGRDSHRQLLDDMHWLQPETKQAVCEAYLSTRPYVGRCSDFDTQTFLSQGFSDSFVALLGQRLLDGRP